MTDSNEKTNSNHALHAWRWFDLHSRQRMQNFNFFVVLFAAACSALATSYSADFVEGIVGSAVALMTLSLVFKLLDMRTSFLIKLSEEALKVYERNEFSSELDNAMQLVHLSDANPSGPTYRTSFNIIFSFAACIGFLAILSQILEAQDGI
ncbi:MAG: hypothetical protein AAGD43_01850 [Pseudomonadota bacterium]